MNYLVTGGEGFIGSHLVDFLIAEGHKVWVLDDLSSGNTRFRNRGAKYQRGSVNDQGIFARYKGLELGGIFHLAAIPRVVRSVEDPIGTHHANVTGFLNVLEFARREQIKLVFASSSSVYGQQDTHEMVETMERNPLSPYALHKVMDEMYAEMFAKLFGTKSVGLRFFNVYGPRQSTKGAYALVIGKFLEQLSNGGPMTIFGDGTQTRDYTFVSDIVRGCYLAMTTELEKHFDVFNLGTGTETDINTIAKMIGDNYEHIIPNPRGEFEEARKMANIEKARTLLKWSPRIDLKNGIRVVKKLHEIREQLIPRDEMLFEKGNLESF